MPEKKAKLSATELHQQVDQLGEGHAGFAALFHSLIDATVGPRAEPEAEPDPDPAEKKSHNSLSAKSR
jgi:hypothetical protein